MGQDKYSLRERKYAKSKISLMRAFIERLKTHRFEEISVSELCASMDISEGTFFNYFPRKIDVIKYFIGLNTTHIMWQTEQKMNKKTYLDLIDNIFYYLGEGIENNTNLIYEIIATLIGQKQAMDQDPKITRAEKYIAFPKCEGIENIRQPAILFNDYFEENIKKAVKNQELPEKTNVHDVVLFLGTIVAGMPLAINRGNIKDIKHQYMKMLGWFWKALGRKDYRGKQWA